MQQQPDFTPSTPNKTREKQKFKFVILNFYNDYIITGESDIKSTLNDQLF